MYTYIEHKWKGNLLVQVYIGVYNVCVYEISIETNPARACVWIRIYNKYKFKGNMLVYVYGVSIYIYGIYTEAKLARIYV